MIGRPRLFSDEERKERKLAYQQRYRKTQIGKASSQVKRYNQSDIESGRGKGNLTSQWMVDNIYTKSCVYCGESDWKKLGCNRIDNSKPHTTDNVEPCCKECNCKIEGVGLAKRVDQIDMTTGEVVHQWVSTIEAEKEGGFDCGAISKCCMGVRNKHKGYYWKYVSN